MTETTSIQNFMRERHTYTPVERRPGLATFMAQAAVGSFCGTFAVMLTRMLLVYRPHNDLFVLYLPFLMALGGATGAVAGLLIWAGTKEADGQLLGVTRSLLGVLVTAGAWFALWYFLFEGNTSSEVQLWLLSAIVVSGVSIGWMTGSRLRLWRELVRGGETKTRLLRILAGFSGLVLRSIVGFSFLGTLILAITVVQMYILEFESSNPHLLTSVVWYLLLLGHLVTGLVILFARMKFGLLVPLTVISTAPVVAGLLITEWDPAARNFIIGYLGAWVLFLMTRWRQTDAAFAVLEEEFRYYLID